MESIGNALSREPSGFIKSVLIEQKDSKFYEIQRLRTSGKLQYITKYYRNHSPSLSVTSTMSRAPPKSQTRP